MQKYRANLELEIIPLSLDVSVDHINAGPVDGYLASEADARIAELLEALRNYGGHKEKCQQVQGWGAIERNPCDCGFAELTNL